VDEANRMFPVVADIGIPVRGLFVLMLLFTLLIGPINLYVLALQKRRIWMLWTVPVISLLTCASVFGYMLLAEGWQGYVRTEGLTILDESAHRATTIGWTAFYSPMTPGDGLHFSYDTELVPQIMEEPYRRSGGTARTLDWTSDQHLASGWVSARIPAHFVLRKSEVRRERVTVSRARDGTLTMVNGLGAEISQFWFADQQGRIHSAQHVPPGSQVALRSTGEELEADARPENLRQLYAGDWSFQIHQPGRNPQSYLRPGCYVAVLEATPFIEEGLTKVKTRKCRSVVYGILRDFPDAN
jgi:hypothetical protein